MVLIDDAGSFGVDSVVATYTRSGDNMTLKLDLSAIFGEPTIIDLDAQGNPESFTIASQAYIESDGVFSLSLFSYFRESIETLKSDLDEGSTIAIQNYQQRYSK